MELKRPDELIKDSYNFDDLREIMRLLRSPGGCPWDAEQTNRSIVKNFIEEVYEAVEAIETGDDALLCEELGDVLLQVVFHAEIARGEGRFSMDDVIGGVCRKLVERHPHIFADTTAETSGEVLKNWESIKRAKKNLDTRAEAMRSVSAFLPALMRSQKVQQKASGTALDWPDAAEAFEKLREEIRELLEAYKDADISSVEEMTGGLLFAAVGVSRFLGVDAESALRKACDVYIGKVAAAEEEAALAGKTIETLAREDYEPL